MRSISRVRPPGASSSTKAQLTGRAACPSRPRPRPCLPSESADQLLDLLTHHGVVEIQHQRPARARPRGPRNRRPGWVGTRSPSARSWYSSRMASALLPCGPPPGLQGRSSWRSRTSRRARSPSAPATARPAAGAASISTQRVSTMSASSTRSSPARARSSPPGSRPQLSVLRAQLQSVGDAHAGAEGERHQLEHDDRLEGELDQPEHG